MDIKLSENTNNLALNKNRLWLTTSTAEYIAQKLYIKFRFFLGEYYLDTTAGIDYIGEVLVKDPNLRVISSVFREKLAETENVKEVISMELLYNKPTRELSAVWVVELTDGTVLNGGTA